MILCALKNLRHFYRTVWVARKVCVHFPLKFAGKNKFWISVPYFFVFLFFSVEKIETV